MAKEKILFTSESVSEGHPDKVADQIADAILDAYIALDPQAHVACEVFITGNYLLIGGEVKTRKHLNINVEEIARGILKDIGYDRDELGTNYHNIVIDNRIAGQSEDIDNAVNDDKDPKSIGAGDQGIMFGYATNESEGCMPLAISIAHKLVREASIQRKNGEFRWARPDMKSQVTIDYSDKNPRIDTILMSIQHDPDYDKETFEKYVVDHIMIKVAKSFGLNLDFKTLVNPSGKFVIGGPAGDTGLTGRKIIVDTYGGYCAHGGGAFSGKDPTKVDRSAAYMARYIAKNLVAAGVANRLQIQLSYAIGEVEPISIGIKTFHTAKYDDETILSVIRKVFDLRPGLIIESLGLRNPTFKYHQISNYGHFGRPDLDLPWEKLDKVDEIKKLLSV